MLTAHNLTYSVEGRRLLDAVSVSFPLGAVSMVVGANGAGKSTLLRAICRSVLPQQGAIHYDGRRLADWTDAELARCRAVLSQNLELPFPIRVQDVVLMGRYPHFTSAPTARDAAICAEVMRYVEVEAWRERNYQTLSGGERQRVHFARVLAQVWETRPGASRYLLLDEPLTYLDIRHQYALLRSLRELAACPDMAIVAVMHDLNLAARYADHVVIMHEGRAMHAGHPYDVLVPDHVEAAFGLRPEVYRGDGAMHLLFR